MTHFDEMSCLLYLDGQLESLKTKELELHLRSCTPCRGLLAALLRESALLHQAMVEEEESVPARLLSPPGREGAPWGWIISLGFAAAGAFTVWNNIIEPWQRNLSDAGFGGGNILAMLFFSGVFWKGWSEMTTVLQVLAAITLSAPLLFLIWRKRHHLSPVAVVLGAFLLMLATPQGASAAEVKKGERYKLPAGETLNNDLIFAGRQLEIEGTVQGDVIAFCESVTIEGTVTGDLIVFTSRLTLSGTVEGDVRSFTKSSEITGRIGRSLMLFTEDLRAGDQSQVGNGALLFGKTIELDGRVGRDVMAYSGTLGLDGFVGGNFRMDGQHLTIGSTAEVQGKAVYKGRREPTVEQGAKLASPLERVVPERKPKYRSFNFYWDLVLGYAAALALGTLLMLASLAAFRQVTHAGRRAGALIGILVLLVVPVAAVIACITLVGFAIGVISFGLWMILLYVAQVYVGGAIGEMLLGAASTRGAAFGRLALGLAIIHALDAVRALLLPGGGGWLLLWVTVAAWGLGAISLALYERLRWKPSIAAPATPAVG